MRNHNENDNAQALSPIRSRMWAVIESHLAKMQEIVAQLLREVRRSQDEQEHPSGAGDAAADPNRKIIPLHPELDPSREFDIKRFHADVLAIYGLLVVIATIVRVLVRHDR